MGALYHANIILGKGDCRDFVYSILSEKLNFNVYKNPDFLFFSSESFGILDARNLEKWSIGKPLSGNTKVYLLVTNSITLEAQNALLKVLEEPPCGTYIFIGIENLGNILPTFLSRVRVLNLTLGNTEKSADEKDELKTAEKFLESNIKDRLSTIRSFAKGESKSEMINLIKNLEDVAYRKNLDPKNIKNILTAKIFASARGSSPKMLLEWLSNVV